MRFQFLIISSLFFMIVSCKHNRKKLEKIVVRKIEYAGKQLDMPSYSLIRYDSASCNVFHYIDSFSSENNIPICRDLIIDTTKMNFVIYCSDTFILKGNKGFELNQNKVLVKKYIGGFKGADTGLILYLDIKFGIIILQSSGWGTKYTFVDDMITESLTNLLLSDTSGFVLSKKYEEKFFERQH